MAPCVPDYFFFVITHMGQDEHNLRMAYARRTIFISGVGSVP
jgi:hypothetical protein